MRFVVAAAAEADKSHSTYKRKRRSVRTPQVSTDPGDYIRKKIGKLDLNDITQLARLIEGHDAGADVPQFDKQITIQEQILALLDPDESPDPIMLRDSLAQLLQGNSKTSRMTPQEHAKLARFFDKNNDKPIKPPRKLKGLDVNTMRIPDYEADGAFDTILVHASRGLKGLDLNTIGSPDFDVDAPVEQNAVKPRRKLKGLDSNTIRIRKLNLDDSPDTEATLVKSAITNGKKNRASSAESIKLRFEFPTQERRRASEVLERSMRHSESPEVAERSQSMPEALNTKRIAKVFETNKWRHTPEPEPRALRFGSITSEMAMRLQRMNDIIGGRNRETPPTERVKVEPIGTPELTMRRQRVVDLIQGHKPRPMPDPSQRRSSGDNQMLSFRMQRVSDIMQKKSAEAKSPKTGGRRKAQREIMRQRFEKSLQMLATEPRLEFSASADLENDYGLQQYRASAPHFGERVKKLERQLQHYVS